MKRTIKARCLLLALCLLQGLFSPRAWAAEARSGFVDVQENAPYCQAVYFAWEKGLMEPMTDQTFAPSGSVSMALLVDALYHLEEVSGAESTYGTAAAWATAVGLIVGYEDGALDPEHAIAREDMAVILYRYAKYKGYSTLGQSEHFVDMDAVRPDAIDAMKWAFDNGIMCGVTDKNALDPKGDATRGQLAYALWALDTTGTYTAMARQRREEIRDAVTDCTAGVTGTIYYISNHGDDDNDGRSPETAWATPYRAMLAGPTAGDAVLFERGSAWYVDVEGGLGQQRNLGFIDGVDVGAYGEGAKPVLRGDIVQANDPAFWELYYDQSGAKIWKAARKLRAPNVIVFNEGEAWADMVYPWWDGDIRYVDQDGADFRVEQALDRDLTFCDLFDLESCDRSDFQNRIDPYLRGALYLRCDAGNPAEVYDVVSVPQEVVGIDMLPHSSLCGLDIRYCTMMGTQGMSVGTPMESYRFRELEIGWCGGWPSNYILEENGLYRPHIAGGAIGTYSTELSVTDSYIHHCGPMATITSMHDYSSDTAEVIRYENQRFTGNLFEYCGAPMHWAGLAAMDNPDSTCFLSNLVYEDNIVMYTGDGWLYNSILQSEPAGTDCFWLSAVENGFGAVDNDGIYLRNNIFYLSRNAIVDLREFWWGGEDTLVNAQPVFSGNTYVQLGSRYLFRWYCRGGAYEPSQQVMERIVGDREGTVVTLGQTAWCSPVLCEKHVGDHVVEVCPVDPEGTAFQVRVIAQGDATFPDNMTLWQACYDADGRMLCAYKKEYSDDQNSRAFYCWLFPGGKNVVFLLDEGLSPVMEAYRLN